jgi:hypothetical protein
MTTALVSLTLDPVPPTVCRVEDCGAVHLLAGPVLGGPADLGPGVRALCGGAVVPGRPERLLVRDPCVRCVRAAEAQGMRTVRDRSTAWVNLGRLAVTLRGVA